MDYYVYVIGSSKKYKLKTYVGWTTNLKNRLFKHNIGKGAKAYGVLKGSALELLGRFLPKQLKEY